MIKINRLTRITLLLLVILSGCKEFIEPSIHQKTVVLLAPSDGTQTSQYAQTFWWEEIEDASKYRLQVVSPDFNNAARLVLDTLVNSLKFKFTLDPGKYEWRVRGENGSSKTLYTTASFTVYASSIKQQQPQLVSPANNSLIGASTTFSWLKLYGADKYHLEIDTNNFNDEKVLFLDKITANLEYKVSFTKSMAYQWRVKALNDTAESKWSAVQNVTFDNSPPAQVTLTAPGNGLTSATPALLKWNAVSKAVKYEVYVYKTDQKTPYNGTFPVTVTGTSYSFSGLLGERIYWQVRAVDASGNFGAFSTIWNFTIQ